MKYIIEIGATFTYWFFITSKFILYYFFFL